VKFSVFGPFEAPRQNGLIDLSAEAKRAFWSEVEDACPGLSSACGCYIFVVKAKRGALPWYVGRTTKRTFKGEALGSYQAHHYNFALTNGNGQKVGVKPHLYFLAKETPTGRFAKPSQNSHADIEFLETFMFGIGLNRNGKLRNSKDTRFLKNIVVPGVVNSPRRRPRPAESSLKVALGL
jgi:hypothetical protein